MGWDGGGCRLNGYSGGYSGLAAERVGYYIWRFVSITTGACCGGKRITQ